MTYSILVCGFGELASEHSSRSIVNHRGVQNVGYDEEGDADAKTDDSPRPPGKNRMDRPHSASRALTRAIHSDQSLDVTTQESYCVQSTAGRSTHL
jgi:hypothetical protein